MSCYSRAETTASSFADADWDLIERIVGAVPEGETGFQEVSAAYDRIMEERWGILRWKAGGPDLTDKFPSTAVSTRKTILPIFDSS